MEPWSYTLRPTRWLAEDLDADEEDEEYVSPADFRVSDTQLSDIHVGLHWDLLTA
jgi:hypothetical protein